MHVSLSNVENVRDKEKMKVVAAAKEASEKVKRAKILQSYNRSNQLRKQKRLEDRQHAREIDPVAAAIDDITLDIIDEEPHRVHKKRNQFTRPRNWEIIAEHYGQWGKNNTMKAFPNEFGDRTSRSVDQALRQWSKDFKNNVPSRAYSTPKAPAYGNAIDLMLLTEVKSRIEAGLPMDDTSLRLLLVGLLEENDKSHLLIENDGKFSFEHGWACRFWKRHKLHVF